MRKTLLSSHKICGWIGVVFIIICGILSDLDYLFPGIVCGIVGIVLILPVYWQSYLKQREEDEGIYSFITFIILIVVLVIFIVFFIISLFNK